MSKNKLSEKAIAFQTEQREICAALVKALKKLAKQYADAESKVETTYVGMLAISVPALQVVTESIKTLFFKDFASQIWSEQMINDSRAVINKFLIKPEAKAECQKWLKRNHKNSEKMVNPFDAKKKPEKHKAWNSTHKNELLWTTETVKDFLNAKKLTSRKAIKAWQSHRSPSNVGDKNKKPQPTMTEILTEQKYVPADPIKHSKDNPECHLMGAIEVFQSSKWYNDCGFTSEQSTLFTSLFLTLCMEMEEKTKQK